MAYLVQFIIGIMIFEIIKYPKLQGFSDVNPREVADFFKLYFAFLYVPRKCAKNY